MKVNLCQSCFEQCGITFESGDFDYAGTHATYGQGGTGNMGDTEISDCCGEEVREVDTDLVEWHGDLMALAAKKEIADSKPYKHMVNNDPEKHLEGFGNGLTVGEEMQRVIAVWIV